MHSHFKDLLKSQNIDLKNLLETSPQLKDFFYQVESSFSELDHQNFLLKKEIAASTEQLGQRLEKTTNLNSQIQQSHERLELQNEIFSLLHMELTIDEFFENFLEKIKKTLKITCPGYILRWDPSVASLEIRNPKESSWPDHLPPLKEFSGQAFSEYISQQFLFFPFTGKNGSPYGGLFFDLTQGEDPCSQDIEYMESLAPLATMACEREVSKKRQAMDHAKIMSSGKKAALGEMAGGIAHEINNPLAIISMVAQKVKILNGKGSLDQPTIEKEMVKIEKTVQRVSQIVKALRTFSRDDSVIPKQSANLNEILLESMILCSEKIKNNGVKIINELDVTLDTPIYCNPVQISQIIINLVSNSFDAICKMEEPWIRFSIIKEEQWVTLAFTDSGHGIPKEAQDKIMLPFYTTKEIGKGTGVGLSLCQQIVQDHGGEFSYNSTSPNTQFLVKLPVYSQEHEKPGAA